MRGSVIVGDGDAGSLIAWPASESSTVDRIQDLWAEILGVDAVGPDDDFFELGGSSLVVAAAVARLNAALGLDLPLRALFEAPTPAEMAELIAELEIEQAAGGVTPFVPEWVIPLQQEGNGRPVFVFPAGHDEMRALAADAQIASHVGRDHPFWGFRHDDPSLDRVRAEGVSMLAAAYVRQMRAMQPAGPYLLFGNCAGGYLAWETARQLLATGEEIAGILFFEVPLRADFDGLHAGITPADASPEMHLSRDYRPDPLNVNLTHLMTDGWAAHDWWRPWQRVVRDEHATEIIPLAEMGIEVYRATRPQIFAAHISDWIARAERRLPGR